MLPLHGGRKRLREGDDDFQGKHGFSGKKARPTNLAAEGDRDSSWFPHDSALGTAARHQPKYDSDEQQSSSEVSEPGSPQDVTMSSGDEVDGFMLSQSPEDDFITHPRPLQSLGQRLRTDRVPTPMVAMRPGSKPTQLRTGIKQHIRQRHPQENNSDHLEVPSPIDEDEVPTPPSAAEAAGSQLSMLTVSDVDMEESDSIPTISIEPVRPSHTITDTRHELDSAVDFDPMDSGSDNIFIRKQRQRSGALSGGNSPVRTGSSSTNNITNNSKRGLSMGFRADCEKCRMRVPGHMNHFLN